MDTREKPTPIPTEGIALASAIRSASGQHAVQIPCVTPLEGEGEVRQRVFALLENIPDPEIPVVSICELGILRDVVVDADRIEVIITPTYSGCPAMKAIEEDILAVLHHAGIANVSVRSVLAPAWTTDWMTPAAHEKLRRYGIAPPTHQTKSAEVGLRFFKRPPDDRDDIDHPPCPRCASVHTERLSAFGSTSCKALYRCLDCREPFDYFKPY